MNSNTFYQAIVFGVVSVLIALILCIIFGFLKPQLPIECENWDKYYVFETVLFLTGFILRYLLEVNGIKTYLYTN